MAYPSLPSFKAIFVGGRPLWLTRLKRKEAKASLYTPEAVKKKKSCVYKKSVASCFVEELKSPIFLYNIKETANKWSGIKRNCLKTVSYYKTTSPS